MSNTENTCKQDVLKGISAKDDFSKDGDLVLIVGEDKRKFHIDSKFVTTFSKVFETMLDSRLSEGLRFRGSNGIPIELELPDDDSDGFYFMCCILYGRDLKVNCYLVARKVQKIAILVDKYDFVSRFYFASAHLMDDLDLWDTSTFRAEDCWYLMTAAYWFRQEYWFHYFSRELSQHSNETCLEWACKMEDYYLGLMLCRAIEELRLDAKESSRVYKGLCLHCFRIAQKFGVEDENCPDDQYHE